MPSTLDIVFHGFWVGFIASAVTAFICHTEPLEGCSSMISNQSVK